jgi:hypothetical protein
MVMAEIERPTGRVSGTLLVRRAESGMARNMAWLRQQYLDIFLLLLSSGILSGSLLILRAEDYNVEYGLAVAAVPRNV